MTVPTLPAGLPPDMNTCLVRGRFRTIDGLPDLRPVTFEASHRLRSVAYHTIIASNPVIKITPDANGEIAVLLPATNDPDIVPLNWHYLVNEPDGTTKKIQFAWNGGEVWLDTFAADNAVSPVEGETALSGSMLGTAGGVATLDSSGNVPESQLANVHDNIFVSTTDPGDAARNGDVWFRYVV